MKKGWFLTLPAVISIFIWVYLFYLEYFHYDNYVYSHFHINPFRTTFIPGIFICIWLLANLQKLKLKLLPLILLVVFCLVSVPLGIESVGMTLARMHLSLKGPGYITQKAKETAFGNDYRFIEFIKRYLSTEKNPVVYLPPNRPPWRHTGDPGIMRSLLYPVAAPTSNFSLNSYVLISSEADGAGYHLWPDFIIPARKIIIYDWKSDSALEYSNLDWDPNYWQNKQPWGLIIRKNI